MKDIRQASRILVWACLFVFLIGHRIEGRAEMEGPPGSLPVYRFYDHLEQADAWVYYRESREQQRAVWKNDRFLFAGLAGIGDIRQASVVVDGEKKIVIQFNPIANAGRRLRFYDVRPGSRLRLFYGGATQRESKEPNYFHFRIWVGRHLLKSIRIAKLDGWNTEIMDLGIVSILNRDIAVTFELTSNEIVPAQFGFQADIIP